MRSGILTASGKAYVRRLLIAGLTMTRQSCPANLQATQKLTNGEPGSWLLNSVKVGHDGLACSFQNLIIDCDQEAGFYYRSRCVKALHSRKRLVCCTPESTL